MVSLPLDDNRWDDGAISPSQPRNVIFQRRFGETRKIFFTPKKSRTYDLPISDFRYILWFDEKSEDQSRTCDIPLNSLYAALPWIIGHLSKLSE